MSEIRVVVAEPGQPAEARVVEDSLDTYQGLVGGGYIEILPGAFLGSFDVVINDSGLLEELPPNRMIAMHLSRTEAAAYAVVGTLFVTKADGDGGWVSLTEQEARAIVEHLNADRGFCRTLRADEVPEPSFTVTDWEV